MNSKQTRTMQRLTTQAAQAVAELHMPPMVFTVEQNPILGPILSGTNVTDELRWWDRAVLLQCFLGPRGGAEFSSVSDVVHAKHGGLSVRLGR